MPDRTKSTGTAPQRKISLVASDRWAACSTREFGPVGEHRHIVAKGALTTVCGATATHPEIWRGNTKKPRCPTCTLNYGTKRENR